MAECYINFECQLFIVVLLESELGVGDFTIDLPNLFEGLHCKFNDFFTNNTKNWIKMRNLFKKQVFYTWFK